MGERKRSERLQRLLIDELNHRVKNTLASVQAIAHLTARNARNPQEFVETFTGRLQALAKTHTLLTQTAWTGADLRQLAFDQLLLGASSDKRIWLSGPSLLLEPQAALQLSLVLHELATNARKYGALSVENGYLALTWSIEMRERRELLLNWQENDGPPVTAPVVDRVRHQADARKLARARRQRVDPLRGERARLRDPDAFADGARPRAPIKRRRLTPRADRGGDRCSQTANPGCR